MTAYPEWKGNAVNIRHLKRKLKAQRKEKEEQNIKKNYNWQEKKQRECYKLINK